MRVNAATAECIAVALLCVAIHSGAGADDRTRNTRKATNDSPAVVVALGEPEWFSNIRNERLVRATVSVRNNSNRSFWVLSLGTNAFIHDYERRFRDQSHWVIVRRRCWTGASPFEIRPGASFQSRTVFRRPEDVGADVRLRVRLYGQFTLPRRNAPTIAGLRAPEEFVSNTVHVGTDPLGIQSADETNKSHSNTSERSPSASRRGPAR
jgi:hypothetical protein